MASTKSKRRWSQFSLRTLLIVMTLFTVTVGWIGSRMYQARINRQRMAEENFTASEEARKALPALWDFGGEIEVHYDHDEPTWQEWLFDDPGVSNGKLESSILVKAHFADSGLKYIDGFTQLTDLFIAESAVTDAGLASLRGLTDLELLDLRETQVTDAGLIHLKGLSNLIMLDLDYVNITDAGLEHLKGLANLRFLYIRYTNVTDEGVKKLQKELPNCEIYHSPQRGPDPRR